MRPVATGLVLAAVALAFADASIVALALPDLYAQFDTGITSISWVLTVYAVAVAVTGLALLVLRRRIDPVVLTAGGAALFAIASAAAGLASSLEILLLARAVQGVGGAGLVMGAFAVLGPLVGDRARATRLWALAGTVGAVIGPALGGALTQVLDWRAVFLVQAPVALGAVVATLGVERTPPSPRTTRPSRPELVADLSFVCVFGALVGALFLGVILLVVVWGLEPIVGAVVVTALPVGTIVARPLGRWLDGVSSALAGGFLLASGLATLAVLPGASPGWAAAALGACGLGFGLSISVIGPIAVPSDGDAAAATRSSAFRHLGLVVGLAIVAPVLAADVTTAAEAAPLAATAEFLDAPVDALPKVAIALDIRDELVDASPAEIPDLDPVFTRRGAADNPEIAALQSSVETSVRDVLTRSFRTAFAVSAGLGLLAGLIGAGAVMMTERRRNDRITTSSTATTRRPLAFALAVSVLIPAGALAAGGATAGAVELADPCTAPADPHPGSGFDAAAQRMVLSGLNGGACTLGVSREELLLSLEPRAGVDLEWDSDTVEQALRSGVDRAISDADDRDTIPGWMGWGMRALVDKAPLSWFLDRLGVV